MGTTQGLKREVGTTKVLAWRRRTARSLRRCRPISFLLPKVIT